MSPHKLRLRKTNLNLWISGLKEVVKVEDMFVDFIQCLVNCAFPLTYPKQNMIALQIIAKNIQEN